ncbi:hypothetical protein AURDEDRAFT_128536 [Auricularia subglabra TFB-10046 SS5]|uniref:F-box domain-containing protein n=1 Tax=Auricularia subglabra (strain TFB-10046 / SS5) TaxID=717982 RepID=J0WVP7_AURST|nr:hypothetical protein AURDEDRAFT_128536 [Auricularia subglabra TFB-10046 SS5]
MSSPQNAPGKTACKSDSLIPDVLICCLDRLDLNDLLRCMKTCRRWRAIARDHPTFSRDAILRDLAPSHYQRFLAQILHKERTNGSLRVKLYLQEHGTLPRKLREMVKRVWARMERFYIETPDTASQLAILTLPSPRLESLGFIVRDLNGKPPVLMPDFLGGQAPVLRELVTMWVAVPAEPGIPALEGLQSFLGTAFFVDSLQNVTAQCPQLESLQIVDPVTPAPLAERDVERLKALGRIKRVILQYRLEPQWAEYLIDALPLSDIRHISVLVAQDEPFPTFPAHQLCDIIKSMPGDLTVEMHTSLSSWQNSNYNFVVRSTDAAGRTFRRDLGLGKYLPRFPIPDFICMRIVRLHIHAPDWDKTCFWFYGLQRLDVLQLIFRDKAVFDELLRPERTFERRPVPVSFLRNVRWQLDTGDGVVHDVDFGRLHAFLRKGTMQPCISLDDQHIQIYGLRLVGEAEITIEKGKTIKASAGYVNE